MECDARVWYGWEELQVENCFHSNDDFDNGGGGLWLSWFEDRLYHIVSSPIF